MSRLYFGKDVSVYLSAEETQVREQVILARIRRIKGTQTPIEKIQQETTKSNFERDKQQHI